MPRADMIVRVSSETVVRESDGRTVLIVSGHLADELVPCAVLVAEVPDDEE